MWQNSRNTLPIASLAANLTHQRRVKALVEGPLVGGFATDDPIGVMQSTVKEMLKINKVLGRNFVTKYGTRRASSYLAAKFPSDSVHLSAQAATPSSDTSRRGRHAGHSVRLQQLGRRN